MQRGVEPVANAQNLKNLVLPLEVDAVIAITFDALFAVRMSTRSMSLACVRGGGRRNSNCIRRRLFCRVEWKRSDNIS